MFLGVPLIIAVRVRETITVRCVSLTALRIVVVFNMFISPPR